MENLLRLYILRHGQTKNHNRNLFNGWTDVPLTVLGKRQLNAAVAALKGIPFTAIYSSDLSRAKYGGEVLAKQSSLPLEVSEQWREMNFGDCEGLTFKEIQDKYPDLANQIMHPGSEGIHFPNGENDRDFKSRIAKALAHLCEKHQGGAVGLVSHSGVGRAILAEFLDLNTRNMWTLTQSFAGLHVLDIFSDGSVVIKVLNAYLGPEGYHQHGPGWDFLAK
ncbi:MAG: histidine phosphatase family protein [Deltaproteobacteria bacterium]|jgi:broad specificity phosphatase PhoE|nr:histidine phosphatase family protein [Deltaproteobacteria bacterium]